jgi:hypothetical protein
VAANEARKHRYVPQFYMRRFACADDKNKIMVLGLRRPRSQFCADRNPHEQG